MTACPPQPAGGCFLLSTILIASLACSPVTILGPQIVLETTWYVLRSSSQSWIMYAGTYATPHQHQLHWFDARLSTLSEGTPMHIFEQISCLSSYLNFLFLLLSASRSSSSVQRIPSAHASPLTLGED